MKWFDGTFTRTFTDVEREFPVRITKDVRLSEDGKSLAVINRFKRSNPYFKPSVPDLTGKETFYHIFSGGEAGTVEKAVREFVEENGAGGGETISLLRLDSDRLYLYAYGMICTDTLLQQESMRELLQLDREETVFILPLRRYLFPCPVCKHHTLEYRGCYCICSECHWMDEGTDDEDAESIRSDYYTIQIYREEYLAKKRKAREQER